MYKFTYLFNKNDDDDDDEYEDPVWELIMRFQESRKWT